MPNKLLRCACLAILAITACSPRSEWLAPDKYREAVTAFYVGLSAMQTTQEVLAKERFERVAALVPPEPAVWANLGLLALRQQDLDQAVKHLSHAASLAPDSGAIQRLQALAESRRGNLPQAIVHWKRAIELDPRDRLAEYSLALETERQAGGANDAEAQAILERLLARGDNLAARIEYVRIAAKRGDAAALSRGIAPLDGPSRSWSAAAQDQLKQLTASPTGDLRATTTRVAFLKNVLLREPAYRAALAEVATPAAEVGQPVTRFLRLPNPDPYPAYADDTLAFSVQPTTDAPSPSSWAGTAMLDDGGNAVIVSAGAAGVRIAGSATVVGCQAWRNVAPEAVAVADLNYDFRQDLALAGPAGLCLLRNEGGGRFADATAAAQLPAALLSSPALGIWPADIDTDGDLDLVVALRDAGPLVLRNNNDGTFARRDLPLPAIRARGFAWADLDGEGVPDAAFVDEAGGIHVLINLRGGAFRAERIEHGARAVAIAAAEHDGEAPFELLALAPDGGITRFSRNRRDQSWGAAPLGRLELGAPAAAGVSRLLIADLDNNGAFDVVATGANTTRVLLGAPAGAFAALASAIPMAAHGIADLDGDGRLELIGLAQGAPARASSTGSKSYKWTVLRPRAATATGDQRINSFGIGGEIELRAGAAPPATAHRLTHRAFRARRCRERRDRAHHLAERRAAGRVRHQGGPDVEGVAAPEGIVPVAVRVERPRDDVRDRSDLALAARPAHQRGRDRRHADDRGLGQDPRRSAGAARRRLRSADHRGAVGDALLRSDRSARRRSPGRHRDLRRRAVRGAAAGAVAHRRPARCSRLRPCATIAAPTWRRSPTPSIRASSISRAAARIRGSRGRTSSRWSCPTTAPRSGPLWLVARGWVHPTDSSVNVAIAQGAHAGPDSLSLHVSDGADGSGRFREVKRGLGFPAGKDKTILIDLSGVFGREPGAGPSKGRGACGSRPTSRSSGIGSDGPSAGRMRR